MRRGPITLAVTLLAVFAISAFTVADDKEKADKAKEAAFCPVGGIGHDVNKEVVVKFEGGTINFCCEKCPAAFEKNTEKFAANARHQLLATGQIEQIACPLSGRKIDAEKTAEVAGLKIAFCCENCQGKVAKTEKETEKVALVFKASLKDSKAFKAKKKDEKKDEAKS